MTQTCPACAVEVPKRAWRCPDCGRVILNAATVTLTLVLAVGLLAVVGVVVWATGVDVPAIDTGQ